MNESYYTCATCGGRVLEYSLCPRCEDSAPLHRDARTTSTEPRKAAR